MTFSLKSFSSIGFIFRILIGFNQYKHFIIYIEIKHLQYLVTCDEYEKFLLRPCVIYVFFYSKNMMVMQINCSDVTIFTDFKQDFLKLRFSNEN